jgi:hypothetical protein
MAGKRPGWERLMTFVIAARGKRVAGVGCES